MRRLKSDRSRLSVSTRDLKKLVYQYKFLKLDLDDINVEHSKLVTKFEKEFEEFIPKPESFQLT